MTTIVDIIQGNQIIPIIDMPSITAVMLAVDQLLEKKISTIELTLRNQPVAIAAAKELTRIFGKEVILGIGTVTTTDDFALAVDCGAQYVVSPGITETLLRKSQNYPGIPYLPGVITASEIMQALEFNIHHLKLFPAQASNSISLLRSFYGPFKSVQFCATGGISWNNKDEYLAQPNIFAVGMSKVL